MLFKKTLQRRRWELNLRGKLGCQHCVEASGGGIGSRRLHVFDRKSKWTFLIDTKSIIIINYF